MFSKFDYYLDESDPDILLLRRQDGSFAAAFSARGATREGIVEAAKGWQVIETVRRASRPLWLYGAGHVGRALTKVLAELPFEVTWLDSRFDGFPEEIPGHRHGRG